MFSDTNNDNNKTSQFKKATTGTQEQISSDPNKEGIEKDEDKMSVNEMITTCKVRYLNAHMKVTRTAVYNDNVFWIISESSHSGSNTIIDHGTDTRQLGEGCNLLENTNRKANERG